MDDSQTALTEQTRQSLYAACSREALRVGGDERCTEYFFVRAQTSRVWCGSNGDVTVADMHIADWCDAIAWSAPGINKPSKPGNPQSAPNDPETGELEPEARKQPRSGAKSKRAAFGDIAGH